MLSIMQLVPYLLHYITTGTLGLTYCGTGRVPDKGYCNSIWKDRPLMTSQHSGKRHSYQIPELGAQMLRGELLCRKSSSCPLHLNLFWVISLFCTPKKKPSHRDSQKPFVCSVLPELWKYHLKCFLFIWIHSQVHLTLILHCCLHVFCMCRGTIILNIKLNQYLAPMGARL